MLVEQSGVFAEFEVVAAERGTLVAGDVERAAVIRARVGAAYVQRQPSQGLHTAEVDGARFGEVPVREGALVG